MNVVQNSNRSYPESIGRCCIQIGHDALVGLSLINLAELLDAHELDAAAVLQRVLQIVCLPTQIWVAPLELNPIGLAYYFSENPFPWIDFVWLIELLLLLCWSLWHQNDLFIFACWWALLVLFGSICHLLVFPCHNLLPSGVIIKLECSSATWPSPCVEWFGAFISAGWSLALGHIWLLVVFDRGVILIEVLAVVTGQASFSTNDLTGFDNLRHFVLSLRMPPIGGQIVSQIQIGLIYRERPSFGLCWILALFYGLCLNFLVGWCLERVLNHFWVHRFHFLLSSIWWFYFFICGSEILQRLNFRQAWFRLRLILVWCSYIPANAG